MRVLLCALLFLGFAARAGAQSLEQGEELSTFLANPTTTAADAYALGRRLFEQRRYDGAERAWLRAYALGREPSVLVGVADTRQRRGDEPGAVAMLEQYLAERPNAPDRTSVEARIATLLQSPAVLLVRSDTPGQAILLDGVPSTKKTPAELEVEPGAHSVVLVSEGKQVGEKTVQLGYGELKELDFTPATANVLLMEPSEEASLAPQLAIEKEDKTMRRAVISTGCIAAGALVTGTVLGVLALHKEQEFRTSPSQQTANNGERLAVFADVSFGLAALSAITSFTLFMTHKNKRKRERETARPQLELRGAGVSAAMRF